MGLLVEVMLWIVLVRVVVCLCCSVFGSVLKFVCMVLNGVFFLCLVMYFVVVLMI